MAALVVLVGLAVWNPIAASRVLWPAVEGAMLEPFVGVTADGEVESGLFHIRATGVSTAPIRDAAAAFLASLTPEQRGRTLFPVDDLEWRRWSNIHLAARQGVGLLEMDEAQTAAAFGLMAATLSTRGFETSRDIMRLEGHLADLLDDHDEYGEKRYWFTVMGEPSDSSPWGWQLDGHHLVVNCFVLGDQVVLTPHLGASTTEAQEKVALQIAEQMSDYLLAGAVANALNLPSVSAEEAPRLRPYMNLVGQLGRLLGQLADRALKEVAITYEGSVAGLNTGPLTQVALAGLLERQLENVNMVNAPAVAEERGIGVSEITRSVAGDYQNVVRLRVALEEGELSVAGTLFSDQHPRVVEINGIAVEAELGANMLYVTNEDRPGFIGGLGTTLGDAGVNIATFHLGRIDRGGEALALIELDEPIPDRVLDAVRALPHVRAAKALRR